MSDIPDVNRSVEIHPGIFWVGETDEKTPFKCNPYVLDDGEEAVLFEPGPTLYYSGVREKVLQTVAAKKIRYILLSHQDPDLCASVPLWEESLRSNQCQIVTHSRTANLLGYYGIKSKMYLVDQNDWVLPLRGGRVLKFLFTPWCHSPGTFMTYDEKTKTLFSGDVFGALFFDWNLFARENYISAMRLFHEDYMASTPHLRAAMKKIELLAIDRIAPQHGSVIGDQVSDHIQFLKSLEDVLSPTRTGSGHLPLPNIQKRSYQDLIAMVLEREVAILGEERAITTARDITGLKVDDRGNVLGVKGDGKEVLGQLLAQYHERFGDWAAHHCKQVLFTMSKEYGLELPKIR